MKILRPPDDRFENLPDYPFSPNYLEIVDLSATTLRIHYVDEGPKDGVPILLMHGEPSWSYLYRKMIPGLVTAGYRVIVPDLIGFGRSDKPSAREDYTFQKHVDWMTAWLAAIDITRIVMFCQDWGGLIGLRLLAENTERFAGVVAANTFLPTGDVAPNTAFMEWQQFSQTVPVFPVGDIIRRATVTVLSDDVIAAYDAPFPDEQYKAGARQFPMLVPISPADPASAANKLAWQVLGNLDLPFLTAFSDQDPITAGADKYFQKTIPGCIGQQHTTVKSGGHFLQEDKGEELAQIIVGFVKDNNLA